MRYFVWSVAILIVVTFAGTGAGLAGGGASTTYADPNGVCAGMSPCFTTIQAAVRSTSPAPGTVNIFPGTYAEDVQLFFMGADVGGARGDITLQTVDGAGGYEPATASLTPALSLLTGGNYPGDVTIRGLNVIDAPQAGMLFQIQGDATIEDVSVTNSELFGMVITAMNIDILRTAAIGNGYGGVAASASGNVTLTKVTASDNLTDEDADGFRIYAMGNATGMDLTANNNREEGIDFQSVMGAISLTQCTAMNNGGDGIDVDRADGGLTIDRCSSTNSGDDGMEIGEDATVPGATITNSYVGGNAEDGVELHVSGATEVHCVNFMGNAVSGLLLETSANVNAEGNWWGDPAGPLHPSNPGGAGDAVQDGTDGGSGTVDFMPFLDSECNIPFSLIWGDVNCDGVVDELDALALARHLGGVPVDQQPPCPAPEAALDVEGFGPNTWFDVNGDGAVNGIDMLDILRHVSGSPQAPPPAGTPAIGDAVTATAAG